MRNFRAHTTLPQCSHITVKRGVMYYRRRLPGMAGEVAVSLKTRDYREAQSLARLLDRTFHRCLRSPHQMNDLQSVLRKELARAIENERQRFLATPAGRPVYAHEVEDGEDVVATDLAWLDADLQDAQRALIRRDTISLDEWMDEMLAKYSLPPSARAELAVGMLRVRVQKLEALRGFIANGAVPPISLEPLAPMLPPEKPVASSGPLFSGVVPGHIELESPRLL